MTSTTLGVLDEQIVSLQQLYPESTAVPLTDGTTVIRIPGVILPVGWNRAATEVRFVVPVGFPMARPDCFWADTDLRLATGAMPQNSGMTPVTGTQDVRLWFSWHLLGWNPLTDTVLTYARVIMDRLRRAS